MLPVVMANIIHIIVNHYIVIKLLSSKFIDILTFPDQNYQNENFFWKKKIMCNTHCKLKNTRSHFVVKGKVWYIFFIKEEYTSLLDALTLLEVGRGMSCIVSNSGPNYFSYYSLVKLKAAQWKWTCVSILPKGKDFLHTKLRANIRIQTKPLKVTKIIFQNTCFTFSCHHNPVNTSQKAQV